jgi:hypothetical protein
MDIQANLPSDNIFRWTSAVNYSRIVLQQQIAKCKKLNLSCNYDKQTVETLTELEIFLHAAWDGHIAQLETMIKEAKDNV